MRWFQKNITPRKMSDEELLHQIRIKSSLNEVRSFSVQVIEYDGFDVLPEKDFQIIRHHLERFTK